MLENGTLDYENLPNTEEGEEMQQISFENTQNLLERSMLGSGCTSFASSGEIRENLTVPNPPIFNCPPLSTKIFLAPYRNFIY